MDYQLQGRVGAPDVGHLVAFPCSAAASRLTGLAAAVDGGLLRAVMPHEQLRLREVLRLLGKEHR
jgi:hypothetical protein